jgi:hypothetical protein
MAPINDHNIQEDLIVISIHYMLIQKKTKWEKIEYLNMEKCKLEPLKYSHNSIIFQANSSRHSILINGIKNNKFLDIYGLDRFIKKILVNVRLD